MRTTHHYSAPVKVLIFGHKEFSQLVSSVIPQFNQQASFRIVDAIVGSVEEVKRHFSDYEPDVIVSGGANAAYLESCLDLPVVSMQVTETDVLHAIQRAAKVSKDVVLLHCSCPSAVLPILEQNLGISIQEEVYSRTDQARELFHTVKKQPDIAIVAASLVCGLAAQQNIPAFLLYSTPSCIASLEQAIELGRQYRRRKQDTALTNWLLKQSKTPIIMTDELGESITLNEAARRELDLSVELAIDLDELIHPHQGQRPSDGECNINGRDWWFHQDEVTTDNRSMFIYQLYRRDQQALQLAKIQNPSTRLRFESSALSHIIEQAKSFASSPSNVLVHGESGTGKELIAREIHQQGPFGSGKFVALNCSAIPSALFEGELFGHQDGAYTGAKRGGRKGLIEEAQLGVLFLDEIGELALDQQAKLLRFLQERMYRPLGANQEKYANIKLVAASNKNLREMVARGEFREDLFFRLNVFNIFIPPLRQRPEDILCIAHYKLGKLLQAYQLMVSVEGLLDKVAPALSDYTWPGNVRELENILERIVAHLHMTKDLELIDMGLRQFAPELFSLPTYDNTSNSSTPGYSGGLLRTNELAMVEQAMHKFSGNKQQVAEYLGLSQTTLWRRLKQIKNA